MRPAYPLRSSLAGRERRLMKENWKNISGYEEKYQVSNLGKVKNIKNNFILKPIDSHGYKYVHLCDASKRKNKAIHRLVALAFIPNPFNYPEVNHKDGNKSNNNVNNLEWCSRKENAIHMSKVLHKHCKKVLCLETGEIFNSIYEAANFYNRKESGLVATLRHYSYRKTFAGYHWEYVL